MEGSKRKSLVKFLDPNTDSEISQRLDVNTGLKQTKLKHSNYVVSSLTMVFHCYFFKLTAAAHSGLFFQDGQEYEYMTTISSAAGTMEVATHSSGEQYKMKVAGTKLNMLVAGPVYSNLCYFCYYCHFF
jgi:hypothetical protein